MQYSRLELEEIQAGARPLACFNTKTFDGGATSGALSAKAALTTSLTGANNDMTFTAKTAGVAGNLITVAYSTSHKPAGAAAASVHVNGNAICVDLKSSAGVAASKVLTSTNTELADGDTVTIDGVIYRFKDTMLAINDVKRNGTTADTTMNSLIATINGTGVQGVDFFPGTNVHPTCTAGALAVHATTISAKTKGVAGNSIAIAENSTQLSFAGGATSLSGGVDIATPLSTAAEVKIAFDADAIAAGLVDSVANAGGDSGAGVVTVLAPTALSGGSDGKVPLFNVTGGIICSLRGYVENSLTGTGATLVHGVTGTTNMLIPILTGTNITAKKGIDKTSSVVSRGTALDKVPLWYVQDEQIFATTATHSTDTGKIHYVLDFIGMTEDAKVTAV